MTDLPDISVVQRSSRAFRKTRCRCTGLIFTTGREIVILDDIDVQEARDS